MFKELLYKKIILSENECQFISNYILDHEEVIKSLGPDTYSGTKENSLTGRYYIFNLLNVPEIENIMVPKFKKIFDTLKINYPVYVQCWANTYRTGDYIEPHCHTNGVEPVFSGNIFLKGDIYPGTKYFFQFGTTDVENSIGEIVVFGGDLFHSVNPYAGSDVRITIGLDFHSEIEKYYPYEHCIIEYENNKKRYYKIEKK